MPNAHPDQRADQLKALASEFVNLHSNHTSLITVTDVRLSPTLERVTFLVSTYPETAEGAALGFLMRKRGECRAYLKEHAPLRRIPHVEFEIDTGEKHRQRVDALLRE